MDQSRRLYERVLSSRKAKSGCRTCKLRKVKCDEKWPVCGRCSSTGRVCDGYGIWGGGGNAYSQRYSHSKDCVETVQHGSRTPPGTLVSRHLQLLRLSRDEQVCLEWYICRTTIKLPGAFHSGHWSTLLFQTSSTEPAVMHAMLALSSAHRGVVLNATDQCSRYTSHWELLTVQQYSKAIEGLQLHFSEKTQTSVRVALIACAVFIYLEFLRGNYQTGINHLQHGLSLLQESQYRFNNQHISSAQSMSYFDGWMATVFTRLLVQAKLFGQRVQPAYHLIPCKHSDVETNVFRSIHHSRRMLEHLLLRTFRLREQCQRQEILPAASRECQRLVQAGLQHWIRIHEATMSNGAHAFSAIEVVAYSMLRLYHIMASIMADNCVQPYDEMRYDNNQAHFVSLISHCVHTRNTLLRRNTLGPSYRQGFDRPQSRSISDIGWIPPLYYTAIKCRNHRIRSQALKMLETTPHKEGIWDAELAVAVARKVISIEEQNFYKHSDDVDDFNNFTVPTSKDLVSPTLPDKYRLKEIEVVLPNDSLDRLVLRCSLGGGTDLRNTIMWEYDLHSQFWSDVVG